MSSRTTCPVPQVSTQRKRPLASSVDVAGWCRPPLRARRICPRCWADLSDLVVADWCTECGRTLRIEEWS
jgi:hypothetical protein